MIPSPLKAMSSYRQFMLWKLTSDDRKIPWCNGAVNPHDPKYWMSYEDAVSKALADGCGVAFVFTEYDPFFFVDIDECLTHEGWSDLANQVCGIFKGAAIEISTSGKGLHIFGSYSGMMLDHGCKANGIEFYHTGRFVALTGTGVIGDCSKDFTEILPDFIKLWCPPDEIVAGCEGWTTEGCEGYGNALINDEDLINKACSTINAGSVFGGKCSFRDLWNKNVEALSRCYPDRYGDRSYDYSEADSALAQHLAFWTGKNCERVKNLMLMSALVRDKWFKHSSYLSRTILNASRRQENVYSVNVITSKISTVNAIELRDSNNFCTSDQQVELFKGCVYIRDIHKIMISDGNMLKQEQFKAHFGGKVYILDAANTKTTDDAWVAFTQNRVYKFPQVQTPAFKPLLPPGEIFNAGGIDYVNTYYPVNVPCEKGDVEPLLRHLRLILPDERDRTIFISYMAACVQYKGVKFQWSPLLQGAEGNGKTLFTKCVINALGKKYCHMPKASKLSKDFNAWMYNKLFYGVEDVYSAKNKYEIWEDLKPMITGTDFEIEGKGVDQITTDICGNFMFNSNHKDALPKTNNDRRLCILFTAQQSYDDIVRDGMTGEYFPKLYEWCNEVGYARFTNYLISYDIPDEFNPAGMCRRAPFTSTTHMAINAGINSTEQEIIEAINMEKPGFKGDFISTVMLDRLLLEKGCRKLSINNKKRLLEGLGYLESGITSKIVMPDAQRTTLFIKQNTGLSGLSGLSDIYENLQKT